MDKLQFDRFKELNHRYLGIPTIDYKNCLLGSDNKPDVKCIEPLSSEETMEYDSLCIIGEVFLKNLGFKNVELLSDRCFEYALRQILITNHIIDDDFLEKLKHKVSKMSIMHKLSEKRKVATVETDFYSSPEWLKLRKKVKSKYGSKCMKCGMKYNKSIPMHIDHIKPRSKYPELQLDFNNLQVLCKQCNEEKSNFHETDYRCRERGE